MAAIYMDPLPVETLDQPEEKALAAVHDLSPAAQTGSAAVIAAAVVVIAWFILPSMTGYRKKRRRP